MTIKLLIADDHELVHRGLKEFVKDTDIKIIATAKNGEQALELALKRNPDVVLLDVRMPNGDGLTTLGRIKLDRPDMPVVMFSAYANPAYVARAVALGAAGYVLKSESKAKLLETICTVATGESTWTRTELRRVTGALATPRMSGDVEVPLTRREGEVLRQMAQGQTNKEIAVELKISYETVKEHVQHTLRKIGVSDRTQAAVWAVRKGLA
jgi:DNA-binding NarL/FixJ family response regulator